MPGYPWGETRDDVWQNAYQTKWQANSSAGPTIWPQCLTFKERSMIAVYIWSFRGKAEAWGHASMLVDRTYMSWWPETPGQVPSRIHRNIYASGPFRDRKFAEDVEAEGQDPDHQIELIGLDESAVKNWWQSFGLTRDGVLYQGPLLPWETLTMNCSTVVAHGLTLAGGKKHASWSSWNVVWTPKDVLRYATAIREGLEKATT